MERALDPRVHADIHARRLAGQSIGIIAKLLDLSKSTVSKYAALPPAQIEATDKNVPEFNWREWAEHAQKTQALFRKAGSAQKFAHITVGDGSRPVLLLPFCDTHIGARGTTYKDFVQMTDDILNTPDVYLGLLGDIAEYAIKLRSVAEVCAQIMGPDKQDQFVEDWFNEIAHKVAFACWGNHDNERAEQQAGDSYLKRMMAKRVVFFDGIGHPDIKVGEQVYHLAVSHKFRGYSFLNAPHAGQRYMRFDGPDREIAMMGHIHRPAFNHYYDGNMERLSIVAGTLNVDCLYSSRHYSLFTVPQFPCIELDNKRHEFTPFKNLRSWLRHKGK